MKPVSPRRQRGAALIIFVTVLVLGIAWFTVGALGKAAPTIAEKEIKTGLALQAAKQTLLAHVAQYAARSTTNEPGQLPCPESLNWYLAGTQGQVSTSCSNVTATIGRLPWRTLGIDQLRDGDGEPLWYVLSPGFRSPPINFGTVGQLNYNGAANAAVALIIAPGAPLNTTGDPATPPAACSKVNQQSGNRNDNTVNPLDPTKFFECGNATGTYANPGNASPNWSQWSNDRVLAITAAEWMDAIAGPVADRLQRQTAPALHNWDAAEQSATGKSWSSTWSLSYLPFASIFGNPTTNNYCGNGAVREGLAPVATASPATCDTRWTGTGSVLLGLIANPCTQEATYLSCTFLRIAGTLQPATVTGTAANVGNSFRGTINASDIDTSGGTIDSFTMAISSASGTATATIVVSFPPLPIGNTVEVRVPYVLDAAVLSDTRLTWVTNNNWHQYIYYVAAPGATVNPASACAAAGDPGCITVNGLPASTGSTNDKRLALALSGRALAGQTQPSSSFTDYLESRTSGTQFTSATVTSTYNDRLAACPFQYTPDPPGAPLTICN